MILKDCREYLSFTDSKRKCGRRLFSFMMYGPLSQVSFPCFLCGFDLISGSHVTIFLTQNISKAFCKLSDDSH